MKRKLINGLFQQLQQQQKNIEIRMANEKAVNYYYYFFFIKNNILLSYFNNNNNQNKNDLKKLIFNFSWFVSTIIKYVVVGNSLKANFLI